MDIFTIAKIVTAVTTITVAVVKVLKLSHKIMDRQEAIESRFKDLEQQVYMLGLMEDKLPIDDRLEYGEKFTKSGGLGYPKVIYKSLQDQVASKISEDK